MNLRLEPPDYSKVAEVIRSRRSSRLANLRTLLFGARKVVEGLRCNVPGCETAHPRVFGGESTVCYPGKVHHLDGNPENNNATNVAMVCPSCGQHILLSRFALEDMQQWNRQGWSYAEIGRQLGLSRERVRQLLDRSDGQTTQS